MTNNELCGVLGIDTSCYTTSLAFVDQTGCLRAERRQVLPVPAGTRGLRQNDAFFLHGRQLPVLMDSLFRELRQTAAKVTVTAVCAAVKPRPVPDSYLPVFRAGELVAYSLATVLGVSFFPTSHQEGHLMAGLFAAGEKGLAARDFLAVHLSGGTTELLRVGPARTGDGFCLEKMGETTDLHAGQLVDRVGVALGLPFPAGPALESLAGQCCGPEEIFPAAVKGYNVSFSGAETQALRRIVAQATGPAVARGVERCLAATLEKILRPAVTATGIRTILLVGGVAANKYLQDRLRRRLEHRAVGAKLFFAGPQLSGDNAVGVAFLGWRQWRRQMAGKGVF
ncbi:MAG: O-sialoglycoprotein endopeptidase [Heliobacteriaceae bacterium]|nr:O-sialoglycoprotein endopeptidase [Heliobacteriaceae bacterium]MDD4587211.1 O-sialoglycoprotein endopeptidase [Heliobacteriaceae bacterium]